MNYSYWELNEWFKNVDFTIVGSGIVGLSCAIELQKKHKKAKILILEKGLLPQGASTKNAGFACFGSISEIVDDLKNHSEEEVFNLVDKRWKGLELLRNNLGDATIDFQQNKGFELFKNKTLFETYLSKKDEINKLLKPIFKDDVFSISSNVFGFQKVHQNYIANRFEGQLDTGKMVTQLLLKAQKSGIKILNNITLKSFEENKNHVALQTDKINFKTSQLFICTNGFASQLLNKNVQPARAQVLITKPIKNLQIKGTFHLDKGYYYFRNINNRILFGGGRNLDFKTEETTKFGLTEIVQNTLEQLLKETILPNTEIEIEQKWSGIMGVGIKKKPIVKQISTNVFCGVRLGGMGVAIGNLIGKELINFVD